MSKKFINAIIFVIVFFSFQIIANAQDKSQENNKDRNIIVVGAGKTLKIGGKITYFVVKETAKAAWETTKFSAGDVAAPIAKAIVVKAAPKVSLFILKRGTPIAAKLVLKYIML